MYVAAVRTTVGGDIVGGSAVGGGTAEAARRALSELAERRALAALRPPLRLSGPYGLAAAPDVDRAGRRARRELAERIGVQRWWCGVSAPRRPSAEHRDWFDEEVARLSGGAETPGLIRIEGRPGLALYCAWSHDDGAHSLCFGFGCHESPRRALRQAFLELVQSQFALALGRARRARGLPLRRRERAMLARAEKLSVDRIPDRLFPGRGDTTTGLPGLPRRAEPWVSLTSLPVPDRRHAVVLATSARPLHLPRSAWPIY